MKELKIEKELCKFVKENLGLPLKFISPGYNGVPDRLCLFPIPKKHINIVNKYIKFVEVKKPGEKPKSHQLRCHKELNGLGYRVYVIDELEKIKDVKESR